MFVLASEVLVPFREAVMGPAKQQCQVQAGVPKAEERAEEWSCFQSWSHE